MKRSRSLLLWVPLLALVAWLASRWIAGAPAVAVGAATAELGAVERLVANSEAGSVRSRHVSHVSGDRAGRIVAIHVREGAAARAGEVLVQLDTTTAAAACDVARRDLEAARAQSEVAAAAARLARDQGARAEELYRRQMISDDERQQALSRRQSADASERAAEAHVRAAAAQLRAQREEIAHLAVHAPFAGVVSRLLVERGESVVPGQVMAELLALDSLYVSAPIDERDAGGLRAGLPARVTLDAYPEHAWNATVSRVAPYAEEMKQQNRTLTVEVDLPGEGGGPRPAPGMTADVELVLARRDGVLRVPAAAVVDQNHVLLVSHGRAVKRGVRLGARNWDWAEIDSGLVAGDRVITTLGRAGVAAGARVRVEGAKEKP